MATIINTPAKENNGAGLILGLVAIGVFVMLFIYFVMPALRRMSPAQINVEVPEINVPAPIVNVESPELVTP